MSDSDEDSLCQEVNVLAEMQPMPQLKPTKFKAPPKPRVPRGKGVVKLGGTVMRINTPKEPRMIMPRVVKEKELDDKEVKNSFKEAVFNVSSKTVRDPQRRDYFHQNLQKSKYLNQYLDKRIGSTVFDMLGEDIKAVACYGSLYLDAVNKQLDEPKK